MITINPPDGDVARETLVKQQTAVTKIKEFISRAVFDGWDQQRLTDELNNVIGNYCNGIADGSTRERFRKSLVASSKAWYWRLSKSVEIHKRNLVSRLGDTYNFATIFKSSGGALADSFRHEHDVGTNNAVPLIENYQKSVNLALKALAATPPKIVEITRGANAGKTYVMPLRNRAEMAVRYQAANDNVAEVKASGVKLVWTSSHPDCSPRCKPFQGRLWSLDGSSGKTPDGIPYRPIEEALEANNGNSIINGYNCRHRLIEYREGSRAPVEFTDKEIKKAYEIDKRQRSYENTLRRMKTEERLLRASGNENEAKLLRLRWRKLQHEYKAYSFENGRAYYPYRYVIDEAEPDYKLKGDELINGLTFSTKNAIINVVNGTEYQVQEIKYSGVESEIKSLDKIKEVELESVKLDHEQGTIFDRDGNVVYQKQGGKNVVVFEGIETFKLFRGYYTHNHLGKGCVLSPEDVKTFAKKEMYVMRAVDSTGATMTIVANDKSDRSGFYLEYNKLFKNGVRGAKPYDSKRTQFTKTNFAKKYGIQLIIE